MMLPKRTKIIATLGPSTSDEKAIRGLIQAGVNIVRLNFSHGSPEEHSLRARQVREIASQLNEEIAILADLQGPKIRIARFKNKKVFLKQGDRFILNPDCPENMGDETQVGVEYKHLARDLKPGDSILLDDGRIILTVNEIQANKVICTVDVGGELLNNKGLNKQGGGLSAEALTEKDKQDLKIAVALEADYIAVSFVRNAKDMEAARNLLLKEKSQAGLIAKIERAEAVEALDDIIRASDGVMVARGDLGVEIGDAELPAIQKKIIQRARTLDKPVITATQMMESMIENSIPTRAEVFDVANAILDGADAVMLSAETATGAHPIGVVQSMVRICRGAEKSPGTQISGHRMECTFHRTDEATAMAAMYVANHMDIKAVLALTESGHTPLLMSRIKTSIPIYALSPHKKTLRKICLYRDVYPIEFYQQQFPPEEVSLQAINCVKNKGLVKVGDKVIVTCGDIMWVSGQTNVMKILTVL